MKNGCHFSFNSLGTKSSTHRHSYYIRLFKKEQKLGQFFNNYRLTFSQKQICWKQVLQIFIRTNHCSEIKSLQHTLSQYELRFKICFLSVPSHGYQNHSKSRRKIVLESKSFRKNFTSLSNDLTPFSSQNNFLFPSEKDKPYIIGPFPECR